MAGLTAEQLAAKITALEEAFFSGETELTYGHGEQRVTVKYASIPDLERALSAARMRYDDLISGRNTANIQISRAQYRG